MECVFLNGGWRPRVCRATNERRRGAEDLGMRVRKYSLEETLAAEAAFPVCVSFNGGAWRGIFFAGVVEQIQATFDASELERWAFCGTSAGTCYALALAMNFPAHELHKLLCTAAARARSHFLGVTFRVNDITGQIIRDMLATVPEDELMARLRGRYAVCFSRMTCYGAVPYLASNFDSKAELYETIVGSANIPFFSSLTDFPTVGGYMAWDGGMTADGCVPLLPSRCNVYAKCFGDGASRGFFGNAPLPPGVKLDIADVPPVPVAECFRTPDCNAEVRLTAKRGRYLAAAFFASKEWAARCAPRDTDRATDPRLRRRRVVIPASIDRGE